MRPCILLSSNKSVSEPGNIPADVPKRVLWSLLPRKLQRKPTMHFPLSIVLLASLLVLPQPVMMFWSKSRGLQGGEMRFLHSFTIETWHLKAHTLLPEQLNSIRWSRWEPNSATQTSVKTAPCLFTPGTKQVYFDSESLKLIIWFIGVVLVTPPRLEHTQRFLLLYSVKSISYLLLCMWNCKDV